MRGEDEKTRPGRALVVSIHDVCPPFEREFDRWCSLLDQWGIHQRSLAVVPFYQGKSRLEESSRLMSALARETARGSEVVLHGYRHCFGGAYTLLRHRLWDKLTTRGCAEFSTAGEADASELLERGLAALRPSLPHPVRGFTAPGWWQSRATDRVLGQMGFQFFTTARGLTDLASGRTLSAPVITGLPWQKGFSSALLRRWNFTLLPAWLENRPLVRVALHPYDLDNKRFVEGVGNLLRRLARTRRVLVYEEYLS